MNNLNAFNVLPNQGLSLKSHDPAFIGGFASKNDATDQLKKDIELMSDLQSRLYAENRRSLLIVLQGMDAAGKDSTIKHVLSGINPQGCEVHSFKHPSVNEMEHDYL
ncbi:polyphosphate kinase 2 family protein, partial [bacterium]|nr:polyphosphate kinase 2 family protein [bacterium]